MHPSNINPIDDVTARRGGYLQLNRRRQRLVTGPTPAASPGDHRSS